MPTQAEIDAYLSSLHQQQVNNYLNAYNNASPEQKAQINQAINPQPATPPPAQQTAAPNPTDATPNQAPRQPGPEPNVDWKAPVYWNGTEYIDSGTGRPAYYGPNGQPGSATPFDGAQAWTQPDGKTVYYNPNSFAYGDTSRGSATPVDAPTEKKKKKQEEETDKGALAYLTDLLRKYGLDSLAPWAMDMLKSGASQYEIIQQLRERPEYKARFPGMDERRAKGLGPLSEEEYMAFENTTKDYMQRAGLPASLYDQPSDFGSLIGNFANVGQVADRIEKGYQQVAQAPIEVRQEMQRWFGVDGDNALAGFFLDPERNLPLLERAAQQAVIGGYGLRQGLDISQNQAGNLADMGFTTQQIQSGMQQAGTMAGLQNQTVDEAAAKAAGLTADTIAGGVFGADAATTQDLKNRLGTRKAQFDTRGTAGATQKGAFGLEAAR